jgi:chemotaxis protein CheX
MSEKDNPAPAPKPAAKAVTSIKEPEKDKNKAEEFKKLRENCPLKIEVEKGDTHIAINLKGVFSIEAAKVFSHVIEEEVIKPYLESCEFFIVNLKNVGEVDKPCFREFVQLQIKLKKQNKKLFIAEANTTVKENFKLSGLDKTFEFKTSVKAALIDLGVIKKKAFDVNFLNPFVNGVLKMMEIQCFTKVKAGEITVLKPNQYPPVDICGTIGVVSDTFNGTIMLHFKTDVYLRVGKKMVGDEFQAGSPSFMDAIGEMCNIVLGQARIALNQMGYNIQQALPSVSYGKDQMTKVISNSPSILIPFDVEGGGMFHMQITTKMT